MKERPILFSAPMVAAILAGEKTQTRRVMKPQPALGAPWRGWIVDPEAMDIPSAMCPYGITGDRLWVREAHLVTAGGRIYYKADHPDLVNCRPSIHMPRQFSRITLEITCVRVQRLQEITEADALAEGMETIPVGTATWSNRQSFQVLWGKINGGRDGCDWDSNPWVWVIEFERVQP